MIGILKEQISYVRESLRRYTQRNLPLAWCLAPQIGLVAYMWYRSSFNLDDKENEIILVFSQLYYTKTLDWILCEKETHHYNVHNNADCVQVSMRINFKCHPSSLQTTHAFKNIRVHYRIPFLRFVSWVWRFILFALYFRKGQSFVN